MVTYISFQNYVFIQPNGISQKLLSFCENDNFFFLFSQKDAFFVKNELFGCLFSQKYATFVKNGEQQKCDTALKLQ